MEIRTRTRRDPLRAARPVQVFEEDESEFEAWDEEAWNAFICSPSEDTGYKNAKQFRNIQNNIENIFFGRSVGTLRAPREACAHVSGHETRKNKLIPALEWRRGGCCSSPARLMTRVLGALHKVYIIPILLTAS